jgi:hypothetical protein
MSTDPIFEAIEHHKRTYAESQAGGDPDTATAREDEARQDLCTTEATTLEGLHDLLSYVEDSSCVFTADDLANVVIRARAFLARHLGKSAGAT